ncbi:MAG: T9SS type A sorting domain-containing protein [Candidatus Neomarinimicrobiota bacterium]
MLNSNRCKITLITFMLLGLLAPGFTNAQPEAVWSKVIGDSTGYFTSVDNTIDAGFILTGPHSGVWVVRVDSEGDTVWTLDIADIGDFSSDHSRIFAASDGGFLLTTGGDPWLIKIDSDGEIVWELAFSTLYLDTLPAFNGYILGGCVELVDGSFVFSGFYRYGDFSHPLFVKISDAGAVTWIKSIGWGRAWSLVQTSSGDLVTAGNFELSDSGISGPGLMKISTAGDSLSLNIYRDNNTDENNAWYDLQSIEETTDNGFIMAGRRRDNAETNNFYVVHANSSGEMIWEKTYGGQFTGEAFFAAQVDTGFIVGGMGADTTAGSDGAPWTLLLSSAGEITWVSDWGLTGNNGAFAITKVSTGEYLFAGATIYQFEPSFKINGFLLRLSFNDIVVSISSVLPRQFSLLQNYPNPFNPITTIHYELAIRTDVQLTIYDLLGKEVTTLVSESQNAGYKSVQWDASNVASGVYIYRIKAGDYVQTRKMVVLK